MCDISQVGPDSVPTAFGNCQFFAYAIDSLAT